MVKVITYGTYDMLHYGHIRLLERAKQLGDYLIVGVTSDNFDRARGKINVRQSLSERIKAVEETGIADEILVEEYEGQKIDDIIKYDVNIFTVGSDWEGHFDYLKSYCNVVYLERTQGVSSSSIRTKQNTLRLGLVGDHLSVLNKILRESNFVNGISVQGTCISAEIDPADELAHLPAMEYDELLENVDAIYLAVHPYEHDFFIRKCLEAGKHIICETPISINSGKFKEYSAMAKSRNLVLMEGIKTAYSLAFRRLLLLLQTGIIGDIVSVEATCTSLQSPPIHNEKGPGQWGSMHSWGAFGLLPVFSILGCDYTDKTIKSMFLDGHYDLFTKIDFTYRNAVASVKVGNGVKSEGELIISGTRGYILVPAPWWKTDYFEVRYENASDNKRYFYQLDGEGIRYMLVNFVKAISGEKSYLYVSEKISETISEIMEDFEVHKDMTVLECHK